MMKFQERMEQYKQMVEQALAGYFPEQTVPYEKLIRNGNFSSIGRCGGADIRHIIGNGHIRFVANCGNHRDLGIINCPSHTLVIERPQVLDRTAAPSHDHHISKLM